jgi:hypothetical protein
MADGPKPFSRSPTKGTNQRLATVAGAATRLFARSRRNQPERREDEQ